MNQLLSIGILPVILTLFAYQIGLQCQKKWKTPLFNPILIGMLLVILFLSLTGMERRSYQEGTKYLSWLMTPATISLAIPMYEQFQILRKNLKAIAVGVAAGTISCLGMVLALSLIFGYDQSLTISLLPKGITTAIGMTLAELTEARPPLPRWPLSSPAFWAICSAPISANGSASPRKLRRVLPSAPVPM